MRCLTVFVMLFVAGSGVALARNTPRPFNSAAPLIVRPAPLARRPAAVVLIPLDPLGSVAIQTPFVAVDTPDGPAVLRIPHYQNPDGSYDSLADLTDAINGVPCGVDCTAKSLAHWGYAHDDPFWSPHR